MDVERRSSLSTRNGLDRIGIRRRQWSSSTRSKTGPAKSKWTPEFFRDRFGSREIEPDGGRMPRLTMAKYIDHLIGSDVSKSVPYLRNVQHPPRLPELVPDVEPNFRYAEPDRLNSRWLPRDWVRPDRLIELFIGGPGATVHDSTLRRRPAQQLHLCRFTGRRIFFMFPPDQTPYLYPKPDNREALRHRGPGASRSPAISAVRNGEAAPGRDSIPGRRCLSRRAGGIPPACSPPRSRYPSMA